jgi:uncharacterized protein (DUF2249 family)
MSHACSCGHETATVDVRQLAPRVRHPRIAAAFHALPAGHAFMIVADHDPKPLFFPLQTERAAVFGWRYLENGPELWRVEIWKRPAPPALADAARMASIDPHVLVTARTAAGERTGAEPASGAHATIDVRGLPPPQPMVRVLERLTDLGTDETLEVLHERRPLFLYPQLDARGFVHETDEPEPGLVRIRIRHGAR